MSSAVFDSLAGDPYINWSYPVRITGNDGIKGDPGSQGESFYPQLKFKSVVFTRSILQPNAPGVNEGSYNYPVPDGWSDGIPTGTEKLWSSSRVFTSDGMYPQGVKWSTPVEVASSTSVQYKFSSILNPGTPASNPENWTNTADESCLYMAVRYNNNGV